MTASDQGVYSAAVNLCATISAVGLAVNNVIFPHLSTMWEEGRKDRALFNLDLTIRFAAVCLTVVGFALVLVGRPLILTLLGNAYAGGVAVLPYLVVFYLFTVSVWLFGVYASLVEKTYVSTVGLVLALPVNVALNLLLIPGLGIAGAGLATMLSYAILWFIVVGLCVRLGMPLYRRTLIASMSPFLILLPRVPAGIAIGAIAVLCGTTDIVLTHGERSRIGEQIKSFMRRGKARG